MRFMEPHFTFQWLFSLFVYRWYVMIWYLFFARSGYYICYTYVTHFSSGVLLFTIALNLDFDQTAISYANATTQPS